MDKCFLRWTGLVTFVMLSATACDSTPVRTPEAFSPPYVAPRDGEGNEVELATERALTECINDARFEEDLTIPDGEVFQPGAVLDKRWLVTNSGTCDWGPGYMLIRTDPGSFSAPDRLALYPARAGKDGPWTISMQAPSAEGEYIASWQAQSPDGPFFGDVVFVLFSVEEDES